VAAGEIVNAQCRRTCRFEIALIKEKAGRSSDSLVEYESFARAI
jgi:hypothetical protein